MQKTQPPKFKEIAFVLISLILGAFGSYLLIQIYSIIKTLIK